MTDPWIGWWCPECGHRVEMRGQFELGLPEVNCVDCGVVMHRRLGHAVRLHEIEDPATETDEEDNE